MILINFQYTEEQLQALKEKDTELGKLITKLGRIERELNPDLFSAVIVAILQQQISMKVAMQCWDRLIELLHEVTPDTVYACPIMQLKATGITTRKAAYIHRLAQSILEGDLDMEALRDMSNEQVIAKLSELPGIGQWTAEMLLIFTLNRLNVLSYSDKGIQKGLRMLYHHRKISPELFKKYEKRLDPYQSIASLYLWKLASGSVEGYVDLKRREDE